MGVGKTTVAEYLSKLYEMNVVEMDQIITEKENMNISDIFSTYGEVYFRDLEARLLIELQFCTNTVISCGGGVVLRKENVNAMKKCGHVVLLTASPETVLERVKDNDERPLLRGNKNIEFISQLMKKRQEAYAEAAEIEIHTDGKSVSCVCEELVTKLEEMEG